MARTTPSAEVQSQGEFARHGIWDDGHTRKGGVKVPVNDAKLVYAGLRPFLAF